MLGHPLCTNFVITKLFMDYVMYSSFAYRQFNSNFMCGDPTILPYELTHSRNLGTAGRNVRQPSSWQALDVYASPHNADTTRIWCTMRDTALRTPLSFCEKFVKNAPLLRDEIG
ncbi:hypothetical protein AVEN_187932-1 [Araneus ventricosus]|uniref:Uncharacterized protein n=1 Tax=Araneus ventricosus TaxID=182803 RepID=A0A4Y2E1K3_ARAVE|nr:hypothetical protein AVEN_187932-1 [Araneus ventricosus]